MSLYESSLKGGDENFKMGFDVVNKNFCKNFVMFFAQTKRAEIIYSHGFSFLGMRQRRVLNQLEGIDQVLKMFCMEKLVVDELCSRSASKIWRASYLHLVF